MIRFFVAAAIAALPAVAGADVIRYSFSGSFDTSQSVSNLNGRAPVPGGTYDGFVALDIDPLAPAGYTIVDYLISTTQPLSNAPDRSTTYDFDTDGLDPIFGPVISGLTPRSESVGTFTITKLNESEVIRTGPNATGAGSYERLVFSFDPLDLGGATLFAALSESYGSCSSFFTINGYQNECGQATSGSQAASEVALSAAVPLPPAALLLLGGLAAMGAARRFG